MRKAFVLLSGGIDSTTCLYQAVLDFMPDRLTKLGTLPRDFDGTSFGVSWVEAVSINYGQRHIKETTYAAKTCDRFGIEHTVLQLRDILSGPNTMLTDPNIKIPNISYDEIKGVSPTYVPYRNGTLLSLITAHAQKWVNSRIAKIVEDNTGDLSSLSVQMRTKYVTEKMKDAAGIYFGAHSEDAANWAYPDCTPEFIGAQANAIYIGTYQSIRLYTPLQWMNKREIIEKGERLGVKWKNTWSCYAGDEHHCGTCPTCRARKSGFERAGVKDSTEYTG